MPTKIVLSSPASSAELRGTKAVRKIKASMKKVGNVTSFFTAVGMRGFLVVSFRVLLIDYNTASTRVRYVHQ